MLMTHADVIHGKKLIILGRSLSEMLSDIEFAGAVRDYSDRPPPHS
jgi:hypothetical protein